MDLLKARLPLAVVISAILSVGGLALGAGQAIADSRARQAAIEGRVNTIERDHNEMRDLLIEIKTTQGDQSDRLIRLERKIDEMQHSR